MSDKDDSTSRTIDEEMKRIAAVACEVIGVEHISPQDNFFDLGADSFDAIRMLSRLGGDMPVVSIFEHPTVEQLAHYLLSNIRREVKVISLQESTVGGSIAVIGVPYGGGDPTAYREMFFEHQNVSVFGVDFGNFEMDKASDFQSLVNTIIQEIKRIDADHYIIYGHCAGAATAACIASAAASTLRPVTLVVAASKPIADPDAAWQEAETTSNDEWSQYLRSLGAFTGLSDWEISGMLGRGRRDHRIAVEAYRTLSQFPARGVPALVLLGSEDPATAYPEEVVSQWSKYIDMAESASVSGGGHYFLRTHAKEVADLVLSFSSKNRKELYNGHLY
ncbi:alpha/beta fold hydrolase [Paenibacillus sp. P46E]|uniref:alpha/beta fold hydrolase n=1 Tax=Paenibacillus sp. P46E TaxID=1349436 RepID=UPI00093F7C76|nr:alpha/beta fold hydrolase [Paenibacillus sp. P46E]OKP97603.1 phosphopantetheine-binding protein [Paenibacillus sp. P46E]